MFYGMFNCFVVPPWLDIYEEALVTQRKKSQRAKLLERSRQEALLAQARVQLHAEQQAKMEKLKLMQMQEGVYQPPFQQV